jgi:hypothetical protein
MDGRIALLTALAISAALAGCTPTSPPSRNITPTTRPVASTPSPTQSTSTPVGVGDGTVTGGMYRCFALPPSMSGPPTLVAGTVDVFRGPLPGLPDEIIKTDGTYTIQLPPGPYELVGHWTGSDLAPPMVNVVVSSEQTTYLDLVYTSCK